MRSMHNKDGKGTPVCVVSDAGLVVFTVTTSEVFQAAEKGPEVVLLDGLLGECTIDRCFVDEAGVDAEKSLEVLIYELMNQIARIAETHPKVFSKKASELQRKLRYARALMTRVREKFGNE